MPTITDGPSVGATDVSFRLRLPADGVRSVRLSQQIARPRVGPHLVRSPLSTVWQGAIHRPDVQRLEYQYEIEYVDGRRELVLDPHNALRAPGPFGDKSVVEFPGYRVPDWFDHTTPVGGRFLGLTLTSDILDAEVEVNLWASPGLDVEHEAPLIVVHDGPEYDRYSALLRFLATMVADGRLPALRVALLPPIDRSEHYAASPAYARALAREFVPVLDWLAPQPPARYDGRGWRVGMGASLGALSVLHAQRLYPGVFDALFLQSGSFFRRSCDAQESAFPGFDRIADFVSKVTDTTDWQHPIAVGMTCGTVEENLVNNRRMRDALASQGYDVTFAEHRDGHNWVGWRDAFDPHLLDLLRRAWNEV